MRVSMTRAALCLWLFVVTEVSGVRAAQTRRCVPLGASLSLGFEWPRLGFSGAGRCCAEDRSLWTLL